MACAQLLPENFVSSLRLFSARSGLSENSRTESVRLISFISRAKPIPLTLVDLNFLAETRFSNNTSSSTLQEPPANLVAWLDSRCHSPVVSNLVA